MRKKDKSSILMISGATLIVIAVTIALIVFFWPKEVRTSTNSSGTTSIASLICKSEYFPGAFFSDTEAKSQQYTIKVTYQNDKFNNVSFSYVGTFNSNEKADASESKMHAKLNLYMYDYGLDPEKYDPNFRNLKNEARIDLFSSSENMSDALARVILSSNATADLFTKSKYEHLSSAYNKIGYSCEYSE